MFTERLEGVKHFGLWPLTAADEACFGKGQGDSPSTTTVR